MLATIKKLIDYLHLSFMKFERIPRHNDQPYLDRWIIFRCRWFGILLHKFIGSDDECLHDHPWWFFVWILKGGYWEWTPATSVSAYLRRIGIDLNSFVNSEHNTHAEESYVLTPDGVLIHRKWYAPWRMLLRPANWLHRVEFDPERPAITLVIHGKKSRDWGFQTKEGWKHHREYDYKAHCE